MLEKLKNGFKKIIRNNFINKVESIEKKNFMPLNYISLFSGIGGFEFIIEKIFGDRANCLGYSEIEKNAIEIYNKNYPSHKDKNLGDITQIDWNKTKKMVQKKGGLDLMLILAPCQAYSLQGLRKGLEDPRGMLIFDVFKSLEILNPKHFIFENVKGLLSITNKKKKVFEFILNEFDKIGYNITYQVLNAKDFGSSQNRERVFIVGTRKDIKSNFVFPIGNQKNVLLMDEIDKNIKDFKIIKNSVINSRYNSKYRAQKPQNIFYNCACITKGGTHKWIPMKDGEIIMDEDFIIRFNKGELEEHELEGVEGRYLTNNEIEKIQGFDIDYTSGVAKTNRYKLIGNSLNLHVINELIKSFKAMYDTNNASNITSSRKKGDIKAKTKVIKIKNDLVLNYDNNEKIIENNRPLEDFLEERIEDKYILSNKRTRSIYESRFNDFKPINPLKNLEKLRKYGPPLILIKDGKPLLDNDFFKRFHRRELKEYELEGLLCRYISPNEFENILGLPRDFTKETSGGSRGKRYTLLAKAFEFKKYGKNIDYVSKSKQGRKIE